MGEKGYVYKFLDKGGILLYVGKTKNIDQRMKQHMNNGHLSKEQYDKVCSIYYTELSSMNDAGILERYMIANLKPEFNKEFSNEGECEISVKIPERKDWKLFSTNDDYVEYWDSFINKLREFGYCNIRIEGKEDVFLFADKAYLGKVKIIDAKDKQETGEIYRTLKRFDSDGFFWERGNLKWNMTENKDTAAVINVLRSGDVYFRCEKVGNLQVLKNMEDNRTDLLCMLASVSPLKWIAKGCVCRRQRHEKDGD